MQRIIASKNTKILSIEQAPHRTCNCRKTNPCPLQGKCLVTNIIYNATVTQEDGNTKKYIGNTTNFKARIATYKQSFETDGLYPTALSRHIHKLKKKNITHNVTWKIVDRGNPFSPVSNVCHLCTKEKFYILFKPELSQLNSRTEMFANCAHKQSVLLVPKERKKGPG